MTHVLAIQKRIKIGALIEVNIWSRIASRHTHFIASSSTINAFTCNSIFAVLSNVVDPNPDVVGPVSNGVEGVVGGVKDYVVFRVDQVFNWEDDLITSRRH